MKNSIILFLSLLIITEAFSQTSVWKVTGEGNTIYFGGTMHRLRDADIPLPAEYDLAFDKSQIIVFEVDWKMLKDPTVRANIVKKSWYDKDPKYKKILDKDVYKELKRASWQHYTLGATLYKHPKPIIIGQLISAQIQHDLGFKDRGVEDIIYKKAKKKKYNKKLDHLEGIYSSYDKIVNYGIGNENLYLKRTFEDLKNYEHETLTLLMDWRKGWHESTTQILTRMKEDPPFYKIIVKDRNLAWIKKIDQYFQTKAIEFILVGNAHMHGEDGLLTHYRNKGYTIEQIIAK